MKIIVWPTTDDRPTINVDDFEMEEMKREGYGGCEVELGLCYRFLCLSLIPNSSFSATILTALFTHRFLLQILGQILNPNYPKVDSTLGFLNCY
ncbi:hypothetical protein P8452_26596 [Trifolium repens]|nr:hypothetical protein P8452_26596 [Trifolium repens]